MSPTEAGTVLTVASPEEMEALGRRLATVLGPGDLVLLTGSLGAGKTTMARGIGDGLGVRGPITSPTFVIARVHPSQVRGPALVHVDAYRLGGPLDVDGLDLDASMEDSVTVVEWGEGLVETLAPERLEIVLERPAGISTEPEASEDAQPRTVTIEGHGPRWDGVRLALGGAPR